jgi:hypothetical protein
VSLMTIQPSAIAARPDAAKASTKGG